MSLWIKNLKMALESKEVVILHGNVRDKYIIKQLVYNNLTELIMDIIKDFPLSFSKIIFYDPVGQEKRVKSSDSADSEENKPSGEGEGDLASTIPEKVSEQKAPPTRILAKWSKELSTIKENLLYVLFYLDKLVAYKTAYLPEEREIILYLEKIIENIAPYNRLILVSLQDTLIPIELYTNSPKTHLISIPRPDKEDRKSYLKHRLGKDYQHLEIIADLTEGLFLRDLDNIIKAVGENKDLGTREIRKIINKYRIGEQEDYWGSLDIKKIDKAFSWFVEEEGIKGQDSAVKRVIEVLGLARAGLSGMASGTLSKPKGVLFFAGPTGVGKTFLAKKLAKFLFGSEEAFLRFDMSEYKEEHTVSKLIGSPPGYVGFESGGLLTNRVREKPFSVLLFDEIEKAHPKIMDIFLQILDEGRLTDSRGQTVFFTETLIIFTSNIGTRTADSSGRPSEERSELETILKNEKIREAERRERIRKHFISVVENFFRFEISRPELLNRIGNNIIPFNYIDSKAIQKKIIYSHFKRIKAEFEDKYHSSEYKLEFREKAVDFLVKKYGERIANFGGRGITNAINDEIMLPLSKAILRAEY
ncbi:MAG: AAA family ATPase, partial [Methanosarcinales archaeon]